MFEQIKQRMLPLPSFRLGKHTSIPIIAIAAVIITLLIVSTVIHLNEGYVALFGNKEEVPVADVVEVLGGSAIPYRIHPDNGQILVRADDLPKARLVLASKGIKTQGPEGYKLMDQDEPLGTSQFLQNIRYKRSIEGELEKSIMQMDGITDARVHLGIHEENSFVISDQADNTASVIVHLQYGRHLDNEQVSSIVALVTGSTPGLQAKNVHVVDQEGNLLSADIEANDGHLTTKNDKTDVEHRLQNDMENKIANLLIPIVGENNYRISVALQVDSSKIEETQERYIDKPRVQGEIVEQETTSNPMAIGVPGTLSNRPVNQAAMQQQQAMQQPNQAGQVGTNQQQGQGNIKNTPQQGATATNNINTITQSKIQRQYVFSRDIQHIIHPSYQVKRITIAIALNTNSERIKKWDSKQFDMMNDLVSHAVGISSARGDSLIITPVNFAPLSLLEQPSMDVQWWQNPFIIDWFKRGALIVILLILVVFGVLPLLRRVAKNSKTHHTGTTHSIPGDKVFTTNDKHESVDNEVTDPSQSTLRHSAFQSDESLPPQSSGLETKVEYLQLLAQTETDRVAEVIKQWINSNDRTKQQPGK